MRWSRRRSEFSTVFIAGLAVLLAGFGGSAGAEPRAGWHWNAIPPRLQWNGNGGYCGEVSLISAGLYFGQYVSQYQARICAIGDTPQSKGEMLLGVNDRRAAERMHLKSIEWNGRGQRSTGEFLRWVRRHVLRGEPVAIGVFNNERLLYGNHDPDAGDPQYDHIVPVVGVESRGPGGGRLSFSDNGLWGTLPDHPYFFTYSFRAFPADRQQANAPHGPLYSLPDYGRNYGIAITGVTDRTGDTLPVRVLTSVNYESPVMKNGENARPAPMPLTLTVVVSELVPGVRYRLYRYDRLGAIPDGNFNARAASAAESRDIQLSSGSTYVLTREILSDEVAAYRCVRATAP